MKKQFSTSFFPSICISFIAQLAIAIYCNASNLTQTRTVPVPRAPSNAERRTRTHGWKCIFYLAFYTFDTMNGVDGGKKGRGGGIGRG